jgi:uncharacterized membrane protein
MITISPRTVGEPTRGRTVAGAVVILAGAVVLSALTLSGAGAPWLLLALGVTATVAWLVDGTSTRYLGPGLIGAAAGAGILIGNALDMEPRAAEHSLVYGGFGIALLVMSYFNPMAARAGGAFLLYTGLTVWAVDLSMGWWLTAILVVWGAYWLVRAAASDELAPPALDRFQGDGQERQEEPRTLTGSRSR